MNKFVLVALITLTLGTLSAKADPGHGTTGQGDADPKPKSHLLPGGTNGSTPMASAGGSNGRSF